MIPARFWPSGISLPGENLDGIPARFPPGRKILAAKISRGSRQDPGPYFTRVDPRGIWENSKGFADFVGNFLPGMGGIGPLLHFRGKIHRERPVGFVASPPS